jgi:hypothetical protein
MRVAGVLHSREALTNRSGNCFKMALLVFQQQFRVVAGLTAYSGGNAAINPVTITAIVRPFVTACPLNLAFSSSV